MFRKDDNSPVTTAAIAMITNCIIYAVSLSTVHLDS